MPPATKEHERHPQTPAELFANSKRIDNLIPHPARVGSTTPPYISVPRVTQELAPSTYRGQGCGVPEPMNNPQLASLLESQFGETFLVFNREDLDIFF